MEIAVHQNVCLFDQFYQEIKQLQKKKYHYSELQLVQLVKYNGEDDWRELYNLQQNQRGKIKEVEGKEEEVEG